jgi:hypothetical protein
MHIDWLTARLVILREVGVVVTICTICYPSDIFIQVRKKTSVSTSRTQQVRLKNDCENANTLAHDVITWWC